MATLTHAESRRMYSWWWDSHISPKNSKWLQENLTDMDAKVKAMIKLIEEDADSFARRAEMYYKKRPELMKLVEEFYRAYRALAERYDHATGALRQAHRTMAEAFPNQVPFVLTDDSPSGSSGIEPEPHTPDMLHPIRSFLDPDDLHSDASGLSSSQFHTLNRNGLHPDETDSLASKRGLKQLGEFVGSEEGRVRKGLNFHENDGRGSESRDLIEPENAGARKVDAEMKNLKDALAKLEAEKEASLVQYRQSLERISNLETEVSNAQEDARGLNEHMRKAESEVQALKQSLAKLEAEKEAALQQYQQCLERISNLESKISLVEKDSEGLNDRASKAEAEVQTLKQALTRLESEKDAITDQYKHCLEIISNMETKILQAEEAARGHKDRADKAESEIQILKQTIAKLNEEKEASMVQYQNCLETISHLEAKISVTQEEIKRLNGEISVGVAKLSSAEQQYLLLDRDNQSLQKEMEALVLNIETQNRQLFEKQSELEMLRAQVQEESLRSVKAEAALQALQDLHSQSQEEQRSLSMDLQKSILMLQDMEHWGRGLEQEVQQATEENKNLNEQNLSTALSLNNMQEEIIRLKEMIAKLEEEVDLRLDQRNALQQEIYCLKEEINDLNRKHQGVIGQVESVGLNVENLGLSVKELQEANMKLNEMHQKENKEKLLLLSKLENMEKLLEKNALLENSLSDVNAELEVLREKVKELEQSCHALHDEKSVLTFERAVIVSQLEIAVANMEKLSEKNSLLENSLSDTNAEIEGLKAKSKSLEESCLSLDKERAFLIDERESLASHLKNFQLKLEELDKKYTELEDKYSGLEKEKESTILRVEELQCSLDLEKQEHGSFVQLTEIRLARLEEQIQLLQEESRWRKKAYEDEQDRVIKAQVEISILQMCILDLEEKNLFLLTECQKYFEKSKLSEELISELKQESLAQQAETKFLVSQIESLRLGIQHVSKVLKIGCDSGYHQFHVEDQLLIQHILQKIEDAENALMQVQDEKQEVVLEKLILVTLLGQLRLEAADLKSKTYILDHKFKTQTEELLLLKSEKQKIQQMKEELQIEVRDREQKERILSEAIEGLQTKLSELQEAYLTLKNENKKVQDENRSLVEDMSELQLQKCMLEEENDRVLGQVIAVDSVAMVFKSLSTEKAMEIDQITKDVNSLRVLNSVLEEEVREKGKKLEMVETENLQLKELVKKLDSDLRMGRNLNEQLSYELGLGKNLLSQKEVELLEVEEKLKVKENENNELYGSIDCLKKDCDVSKVKTEELEMQILELSELNTQQKMEICNLHDTNERIKSELANLHEDMATRKIREEKLSSELAETRNEVKCQEAEAAELHGELHLSTIFAALFEGKVRDLFAACHQLGNERTLKSEEVEKLKERILALEHENGGLKSELATCLPIIYSLRESLNSIEDHVVSRTKALISYNHETKEAPLVSQPQETSSCMEVVGVQNEMAEADGISNLHELLSLVKAVEKAVIEMERVAMEESFITNIKLEAAIKEIEELKSRRSSAAEEKLEIIPSNHKPKKAETEISRARSGTVIKDILLDQVSESSSYENAIGGPQGKGQRESSPQDDQMLELWEATEQDCIVYHQNKKAPALTSGVLFHQIEAVEEQRSGYPSSELQTEKELAVDKLEISKRFKETTRQGTKKKTLERLASDAQKLINLQITVEDLKKKVAISNKGKHTKGMSEYEDLRRQLEIIEDSLMQLVELNGKLTKNAEGSPSPSRGKSGDDSDESGRFRRRRVIEQARRGSEKIGRLQLEVQQIQFVLLKLEDEKETKGTSITKRSTRVLLRDYIYGGGRNGQRRKKAPCCACMRPATNGD